MLAWGLYELKIWDMWFMTMLWETGDCTARQRVPNPLICTSPQWPKSVSLDFLCRIWNASAVLRRAIYLTAGRLRPPCLFGTEKAVKTDLWYTDRILGKPSNVIAVCDYPQISSRMGGECSNHRMQMGLGKNRRRVGLSLTTSAGISTLYSCARVIYELPKSVKTQWNEQRQLANSVASQKIEDAIALNLC